MIVPARPAALQAAFDRAVELCGASRWSIDIHPRGGAMIDIVGRGDAAGRAFTARSSAIRLKSSDGDDPIAAAIRDLELRLAALADRFYSLLPVPAWTDRETASLTARGKVERARSEYSGSRLDAIRLGPADWFAYALETGSDWRSREHVLPDGVAIRPGRDLRYEIAPV